MDPADLAYLKEKSLLRLILRGFHNLRFRKPSSGLINSLSRLCPRNAGTAVIFRQPVDFLGKGKGQRVKVGSHLKYPPLATMDDCLIMASCVLDAYSPNYRSLVEPLPAGGSSS